LPIGTPISLSPYLSPCTAASGATSPLRLLHLLSLLHPPPRLSRRLPVSLFHLWDS